MKRIALLVCATLLLVCNVADAQQYQWNRGYTQQTQAAPQYYYTYGAQTATYPVHTVAYRPQTVSYAPAVQATPVAYSTSSAQGVANLMATYNRVGHWGGNTGYEGCGAGATPAAAYNNCCFANSGMATVDVGYAQSASGMWYCCRRYR